MKNHYKFVLYQPIAINNSYMQTFFVLISVIILVIIEKLHLNKLFNEDGSRKK
ncbi:hypothetical protein KPL37_18630 [Clostridium frigoris]|uniref:Uncharacterized protein n=1 Tax=Clostridium frigoris TaxID=205327 RepID=A0ABS6BYM0_9CLOT|nr:hypothetical protein [Clostridium frigoris]MBU3161707.1 hypothetical protein [Clostridium frigoris]